MPKAKKPTIVEDEVTFDLSSDTDIEFDIAEESFSDADIQAVADEIIKDATRSNTEPAQMTSSDDGLYQVVAALSNKVDKLVLHSESTKGIKEEAYKKILLLSDVLEGIDDKLTQLVGRDDPSKILGVLSDMMSELTTLVQKPVEAPNTASTAPVNRSPSYVATSGSTELDKTTEVLRACLLQLSEGKTYGLVAVTEALAKKLNVDKSKVGRLICDQTDLVSVSDGKVSRA